MPAAPTRYRRPCCRARRPCSAAAIPGASTTSATWRETPSVFCTDALGYLRRTTGRHLDGRDDRANRPRGLPLLRPHADVDRLEHHWGVAPCSALLWSTWRRMLTSRPSAHADRGDPSYQKDVPPTSDHTASLTTSRRCATYAALTWERDPSPQGIVREELNIVTFASGNRTVELGQIGVPTLVIHGDRDRNGPADGRPEGPRTRSPAPVWRRSSASAMPCPSRRLGPDHRPDRRRHHVFARDSTQN